jgi:ABC-type transport system substrate-binding protein
MTTLHRRSLLASPALIAALGASEAEAQAAAPLRIAMSIGDVPRLWGGPEAGFEGVRFGSYFVYDSLALWDLSSADKASGLMPGLATSWRVDEADRKRWIVELRQGVKFHDGSPFDADAAVWNFDSIFNNQAPQFEGTRSALVRGRVTSYAGVEKLDTHRIALTTRVPDATFPYQMAFIWFASPTHWRALGGDWAKFAMNPSGTGPYKVTGITPRQRADLEANRDYWDPKRIPKAARTALLPIPDGSARVAALRSGQVDLVESLPPDTIPSLRAARFQVVQNAYPHIWAWRLNVTEGSPFADLRVRRAANLSIDRVGIVALLSGAAQAALGKVTPDDPWFGQPTFRLRYDLNEARRLMTEAGYSANRRCAISVIMPVSGGGQMVPQPMNEAMQAGLRDAFFDVTFQPVDFATSINMLRAGARDPASRGGHAINIAIPSMEPNTGWLIYDGELAPPRGINWGMYNSPAVNAQIATIRQSFDPAAMTRAVARLHEILVEEAALLAVVHDLNPRALSPRCSGFVQAKNWFQDYTQISVG